MTVDDLYRAGQLQAAIDAQVQEVKAHPADHSKRLFLFELLVFSGDLDRARRQIDAIQYGDVDLDMAVQSYRKLLDAETGRRNLFAEGLPPSFLGEPPDHVRLRLEAVEKLRAGQPAEAAEVLGRAVEATPPVRGQLNGKPFEFLRDVDDLFGGLLEVMAQGKYFWVGLEQVVSLGIGAPRFPRDLIFVPARLEMKEEAGDVFLPALYPRSHEHPDDRVKLGRLTEWNTPEGGPTLGVGTHTFQVDEDDISLLEWRELRLPQE
jgi:type VI secretion system protein ImpE